MKHPLTLICAASLLASCRKNESRNESAYTGSEAQANQEVRLLTTEFPPELISGTPKPVHLHGVQGQAPQASQTQTPGTKGISYSMAPPAPPTPSVPPSHHHHYHYHPSSSTGFSVLDPTTSDFELET